MAMNTPSRIWVRVSLLVSVAMLFVARRPLSEVTGPAKVLTWLAILLFVGGFGAQVWRWVGSKGRRRQAETTLLLCYLGLVIAAVMYFLTTKTGLGLVGLDGGDPKSIHKFTTMMMIGWLILAACSVIPAIFMEATVGEWTSDSDDDAVEFRRMREMGLSGLTIALAAAFLMVTCNVAKQKNVRKDVSYFKTAQPGDSTRKIVESMKDPVRVLLFFPAVNEVADELEGYFRELGRRTKKVVVERHDRMASAQLAAKYQVQKEGTVVLVRGAPADDRAPAAPAPTGGGDKSVKFDMDLDFEKARRQTGKLRVLDQTVNSELLKLVREKRKAYLTVGHGEINDPESLPPQLRGRYPDAKAMVVKTILGQLNYEVKTLGAIDLNREVPEDATVVLALGPKTPFETGELAAMTRYLDRGGRVLVAVDPQGEFTLGPLEDYFGVTVDRNIIHDDRNYQPERGQPTDKMMVLTNGFSSHPSTTSLSRGAANQGIMLQTSGALVEHDFGGAPAAAAEKPKRTIIVRSMSDSWLDKDGNHGFDAATEKRDRYPVGAAVEGPKVKQPDGTEAEGWRALVFSDNDLFADRMFQTLAGQRGLDTNSRSLPDDGVRWLGGEEAFAGIVNNEKETEVKQTKRDQAAWFTATTVLAPLAVLGLGLLYSSRVRRRRSPPTRPRPTGPSGSPPASGESKEKSS